MEHGPKSKLWNATPFRLQNGCTKKKERRTQFVCMFWKNSGKIKKRTGYPFHPIKQLAV
jgi:hypothetical protein